VNGDGMTDIISANCSANSISVLYNGGELTFDSVTTVTVGSEPVAISYGDFDSDRDIDFAVVNQSSNTVSILLNENVQSISGKIFNDKNGDSLLTVSEKGLKNWSVTAVNSGKSYSTETDINGSFVIANLPEGTYTIKESLLTFWKQSAPKPGTDVTPYGDGQRAYNKTLDAGQEISSINFGNLPDDPVFFRTVKTGANIALTGKASKIKYIAGVPNAPNWVTVLEAQFKKFGKTNSLVLGIKRLDSAKFYGWAEYKKASDMTQLYTSAHTNENELAFPFDVARDDNGNSKVKKLLKALKPNRKNYNNIAIEQGFLFKFNLEASEDSVLPPTLGNLLYDADFTFAGRELRGVTLKEIGKLLDTVMTYFNKKGFTNTDARQQLYTFSDSVLRGINEAFYDSLTLQDIDSVEVVVKKNPYGVKLQGARSAGEIGFLKRLVEIPKEETEIFSSPLQFRLDQNYPNPFNPQTTLSFGISNSSLVTLKIYNVLGQEVATLLDNELMEAGTHGLQFDASRLSSGVYFYRLNVQGENGATFVKSMKMVLMK
ncbi:MAG: T9SS type A sorting domain-containing protein, partial [Bacteroidota bacterium]